MPTAAQPRASIGREGNCAAPTPAGPAAIILWDQPISTVKQSAYADQDFEATHDDYDIFVTDDFTNTLAWSIGTIFVPGDTWNGNSELTCANSLNWQIYADNGGVPSGDPWSGGAYWSLSLPPTDPQVTLSLGTGLSLTNATLNLTSPLLLPPGTWWLVFYPQMDFDTCGQYGRQLSETTNGHAAQVINPGGGFGFPTTWTSVQISSTWGLTQQDFAFRLEGAAFGWSKYINGQPWAPGMTVTAQTSDILTVTEVITSAQPFTQIETYYTPTLTLVGHSGGNVFVDPTDGLIVWDVPTPTVPMTLTKWFHVEPCTWTQTILWEELWVNGVKREQRPVTVTKLAPDLHIASTYIPEAYGGAPLTFTLDYSNTGGYENDVWITGTFPISAPFVFAAPPPTNVDPAGLWAEWALGDLPMGAEGRITVTLDVTDALLPLDSFAVTGHIVDHTGVSAASATSTFHVPCAALTGVAISGPTTGFVGTPYTFTAATTPANASSPITYTWSPAPQSGQGTPVAVYTWDATGSQVIHLTAGNCGGNVTAAHTIALTPQPPPLRFIYLPLIIR